MSKKRGELLERRFAHVYDTGGIRRVHLRGKEIIANRALLQGAAFNLSLILRQILQVGTPRQDADLRARLCLAILWLGKALAPENPLFPEGELDQAAFKNPIVLAARIANSGLYPRAVSWKRSSLIQFEFIDSSLP